jgi:hypothetical protein
MGKDCNINESAMARGTIHPLTLIALIAVLGTSAVATTDIPVS